MNLVEGAGTPTGIPIPPVPLDRLKSGEPAGPLQPETLVNVLTDVVSRGIRRLPSLVSKNAIWMGVLAVLWFVLMTYPTAKLPVIGTWLVFFTAAYNNFIAKAIYVGVVNTAILPLVKEIKEAGLGPVVQKYRRALSTLGRAWQVLGQASWRVLLLYGGAGLIFSNVLNRNNKIDKYFITLMTAFAVFNSLSRGRGDVLIRLFKAGYRQFATKTRAPSPELIHAAFASFSIGLALSFIPGMLSNSFWDYKGYLMGAIAMAGGFVLRTVAGRVAK